MGVYVEDQIASLLMEKGFEEINCTVREYYDDYGRFHEIPFYESAICYQKEYEWGTATISALDLDLDEVSEVTVYLNINDFPPTIVERIIDDPELNDAYDELIDATYDYKKANLSFYSDIVPVDYNLELLCKKDELISCVENVSSWINDYIEYLKRVAEGLLRKYKPDELNNVECPKCHITIRKYEYEYHLTQHEIEEAKEQFHVIRRMISDEYVIPDRAQYPLAFKYFEDDIKNLIKVKILPMYKGLAREINKKIEEKGISTLNLSLNLRQFLHYFSDIPELIIKNVPREIRREFVLEYTNISRILSSSALEKFINIIENEERIPEISNLHFSTKLERKNGMYYVHIYVNGNHIAYLKVDGKIKNKIRNIVAQYLIDPVGIEKITENLYNEIRQKLAESLRFS